VKTLIILGLIMTYGPLSEVKAQSQSTRIVRLEVDGKEVKKSYRIFFLSKGTWTEAQTTAAGFTLPRELENEEHLTVMIAFGKHRLKFERLHISNFKTDWIVGVDKQPFSEEFVKPDQQKLVEQVYYVQFEGEPGRQLIVTKPKKQRFH
jgi:hypothetical protein